MLGSFVGSFVGSPLVAGTFFLGASRFSFNTSESFRSFVAKFGLLRLVAGKEVLGEGSF